MWETRAERVTEGDKGQKLGGNDQVQVKKFRGNALMCCLQQRQLEAPV